MVKDLFNYSYLIIILRNFQMTMAMSLNAIRAAAEQLKGVLIRTPTIFSPWLSALTNAKVYLKLENLQVTGSFKPRGSLIKMLQLSLAQRQRGVVTISAGNHAQGVAYHAQRLGVPATIIMPVSTPFAKIERTESYGAKVLLAGDSLSDLVDTMNELVIQEGLTVVHPFDDEAVIVGQGTVGLEMLEDVPELDTLIIPVGGGGLSAGVSLAAHALNPHIDIYGVQSIHCPAMIQLLYPHRWFMKPEPGSIALAEGIAVKVPGKITAPILKEHLKDIIAVSEEAIEAAMDGLMIHNKVIAEGAGAAGVAALMEHSLDFAGKTIGIVVCGGNVDSRVLAAVAMRSLVHQGKLVRLLIRINDTPGVLSKLSKIIGEQGANIYELSHQRLFNDYTAKMAEVEVVIETRNRDHVRLIIAALNDEGFKVSQK